MGKDEREGNSPSFFNPEEAATVTSYLKLLLAPSSKKGKARLSPRSVGVISPYRKQVRPSIPSKDGSSPGDTSLTALASAGPISQNSAEVSHLLPLCSPAPWPPSCLPGFLLNLGDCIREERLSLPSRWKKSVIASPNLTGSFGDWMT